VVFWVHIVFSFFCGVVCNRFAIVEFHQLLSQKKRCAQQQPTVIYIVASVLIH
jgi:hypothetical protein